MKHFWTAAAVTALLGISTTGADAAPRHKKHAAVAESDSAEAAKPAAKGSKGAKGKSSASRRDAADEPVAAASNSSRRRTRRGKAAAAEPVEEAEAPARGRGSRTASTRAERRAAARSKAQDAQPAIRTASHGAVKTEAPEPVTVGKGDTLYALSRKTGVDRDTIAKLNGLKPPYHLKPGQEIKLPSRRYYAVQKGDTLSAVAKKLGTEPVSLAAYNETGLNERVKAGDKIYLPDDVTAPEPEPAKPTRQASNRKTAPAAAGRGRAKPVEVAEADDTPPPRRTAPVKATTPPATRRTASAASTSAPKPATAPTVRYAEARPYVPEPVQPQPSAAAANAPSDGLDAATGLQAPADTPATASQPPATRAPNVSVPIGSQPAATRPAVSPVRPSTQPAQVATAQTQPPAALRQPQPSARPPATQPRTLPPAYVRPSYTPPPAVTTPSNGFQMTPQTQEMASNTRTQPSTGVPYTTLGPSSTMGRSGGRDRQGRPTTLPPQVAMEAPSSQPPILQQTPAPTLTDIVAAGRGRFVWPVRGAVLSGFGRKAGGQSNDGLNIAAQPGEAVRAAAAGEVVYAGDQVPSFGNLVLVKHANGWVTAYAHMSGITVKNRDQVAQGQQIGIAGNTGNVGVTQLHFEMRYSPSVRDKATPIDPMLILPGL